MASFDRVNLVGVRSKSSSSRASTTGSSLGTSSITTFSTFFLGISRRPQLESIHYRFLLGYIFNHNLFDLLLRNIKASPAREHPLQVPPWVHLQSQPFRPSS